MGNQICFPCYSLHKESDGAAMNIIPAYVIK